MLNDRISADSTCDVGKHSCMDKSQTSAVFATIGNDVLDDDKTTGKFCLPSFDDSRNGNSLHLDGALYRIMEYLTPHDFYTLGSLVGSRSWEEFLFVNPHTEYLFCSSRHDHKRTKRKGRTYLRNVFHFRQAVLRIQRAEETRRRVRKRQRRNENCRPPILNRIGIFSGPEEDSILANDSNGYFGIAFLRPGVLAIWGDYSGVFLTPSVDRIFSSTPFKEQIPSIPPSQNPSTKGDENKKGRTDVCNHDRCNSFIGRDGSGYLFADLHQVVAVHFGTPYFFLGFALGQIQSIDSNPVGEAETASSVEEREEQNAKTENRTEYPHVSECLYHFPNGEISCLCPVDDKHLVSSCMGRNQQRQQQRSVEKASVILVHWNALEDGNLQRVSKINLRANHFDDISVLHDISPMAMASSSFRVTSDGRTSSSPHTILSIGLSGQALGHLCLWETSTEHMANETIGNGIANESCNETDAPSTFELPPFRMTAKEGKSVPRAYKQRRFHNRNRHVHHFVYLRYFERTKLIVGTSKGDLFKIDMEADGESPVAENSTSSVLFNCCRGGMVEAVELVGHGTSSKSPILVTAGGYDGRIRFWDWKTFAALGSLRIHPGQPLADDTPRGRHGRTSACSPVVSTFFCHERSSLVSFCRDGHVHEWKVEEEAKKRIPGDETANEGGAKNRGERDGDESNETTVHRSYPTRHRSNGD